MEVLPSGALWCVVSAESVRAAFDAARAEHVELAPSRRFFVNNPGRPMSLADIRAEVDSRSGAGLRAPRGAVLCYCTDDGRYVFVRRGGFGKQLIDADLGTKLLAETRFTLPNGLVVAEAPLWESYRVCEVRQADERIGLMSVQDNVVSLVARQDLTRYRIVDARGTTDALLSYLRDTLRMRIEFAWDPVYREALYIENRVVRSRGKLAAELLAQRVAEHIAAEEARE